MVQGQWSSALGGQGKVNLDAQPFAVEVVQHVQKPELAAIAEPVGHEVHRPGHVRRPKRYAIDPGDRL